jgi:chemotaxis protein MotA
MDLATIIGIISGIGLIVFAMQLGGSLMAFVNVAGLAIVVGGTIAATLVMQRLTVVIGAIKVGLKVLTYKMEPADKIIESITALATIARKEGLLALEKEEIANTFLEKGINMVVDGLSDKDVESVLRTEMNYMKQRHRRGQKVFKFLAATAPAFGMVGTLIGLVQMLMTMADPSSIGPAMAVALLTTLYGAIMAFLFFAPMAAKLESRTEEETSRLEMILAGLGGIMNGDNPRIIEQQLIGFLDPKERAVFEKKNEAEGR